jgi:hypothetical protein
MISLHQVVAAQAEGQASLSNPGRSVYHPFQEVKAEIGACIDPRILQHFPAVFLYGIDKPSIKQWPGCIDQIGTKKGAIYQQIFTFLLFGILPRSGEEVNIWIGRSDM